eukprot:TRINITY_DN3580_c0_g2_i1.p1 TRINITY_DN3580_c0_g2~~TRINITY_DN3580_c0_g2_i1.p1  ORF type:complete len:492 (+),score=47.53 TRINITY_DN3580_c0_g2_i1:85-1560(+)
MQESNGFLHQRAVLQQQIEDARIRFDAEETRLLQELSQLRLSRETFLQPLYQQLREVTDRLVSQSSGSSVPPTPDALPSTPNQTNSRADVPLTFTSTPTSANYQLSRPQSIRLPSSPSLTSTAPPASHHRPVSPISPSGAPSTIPAFYHTPLPASPRSYPSTAPPRASSPQPLRLQASSPQPLRPQSATSYRPDYTTPSRSPSPHPDMTYPRNGYSSQPPSPSPNVYTTVPAYVRSRSMPHLPQATAPIPGSPHPSYPYAPASPSTPPPPSQFPSPPSSSSSSSSSSAKKTTKSQKKKTPTRARARSDQSVELEDTAPIEKDARVFPLRLWHNGSVEGDDVDSEKRRGSIGTLVPITTDEYPAQFPRYFFKTVAVIGHRYFSVYDGKTEFQTGQPVSQSLPSGVEDHEELEFKLKRSHFVFVTAEEAKREVFPPDSQLNRTPRALIRVVPHGMHVCFGSGRYLFQQIVPLDIIDWKSTSAKKAKARKKSMG